MIIPSIFDKTTLDYARGIVVLTDAKEEVQYGRIKVQVWGVYPDDVKPSDLPWAWPETPGIIGGKYQAGWSSVPELGSIVRVYFDYGDINSPIYNGTVPGLQHKPKGSTFDNTTSIYGKKNDKTLLDKEDKHEQDFHRLALSAPEFDYEQDLDKRWEPEDTSPEYFDDEEKWRVSWASQHKNVVYPYNHVFSTGRHTLEYDNTDGYERISLGHWNGSFISLDWEGDHISKSVNNTWTISDMQNIEWTKENKVSLSKNNVKMVEGDDVLMIGGTTARYYGYYGDQDFNYEGNAIFDEVSKEDGEEGAKTYWKFRGDLEYSLMDSWIIELLKDYHLSIGGDLHNCITGNVTVNTGGEYDVSSGGTMNFNAPLIKLNCGGPATALCPSPVDPLTGDSTDPERKEQADTSDIEDQNKALVDLINKEIGAKCQLLQTGDVAG